MYIMYMYKQQLHNTVYHLDVYASNMTTTKKLCLMLAPITSKRQKKKEREFEVRVSERNTERVRVK